jgi:hypothetical protein
MKNAPFWDVTPCGSCKNGRFGITYRLHFQGRKSAYQEISVQFVVMQISRLRQVDLYCYKCTTNPCEASFWWFQLYSVITEQSLCSKAKVVTQSPTPLPPTSIRCTVIVTLREHKRCVMSTSPATTKHSPLSHP